MISFAIIFVVMISSMALLQQVAANDNTCADETAAGCNDGEPQKAYYERASHYDALWGSDNLHLGYYPHLVPPYNTRLKLNPPQASLALTEHMATLANIGEDDRVLDLGSGKGITCFDIASFTGASCTGIDLTPSYVARAKILAAANPQLKLDFYEGSFTNLTKEIVDSGPYDVVISLESFCHVHNELDNIFAQALSVLTKNGRLIVSDYLGGGGDSESIHPDTLRHVYKRLHFPKLHGHKSWRRVADGVPQLELLYYENLDLHMLHFYRDLAMEAHRNEVPSADGTGSLGENYDQTALAIERNEIGMNVALFRRLSD